MAYFNTTALSANTVKQYTDNLTKWLRILPAELDEEERLRFLVCAPYRAISYLLRHLHSIDCKGRSPLTLTNLRHYLLPVLAILRYSSHLLPDLEDRMEYYQTWLAIVDRNSKPMMDRRLRQLPTNQQLDRGGVHLTFADLIAARDRFELVDDSGLDGRGTAGDLPHLLLSMYTYLYPVRADYFATQIVEQGVAPHDQNYLRWIDSEHSDAELVLRDFKTARVFGEIRHPRIGAELARVIRLSLQKKPRNYLFVTSRGAPFTRNSFSRWASETLHEVMGTALNLTMVRHLFISTLSMDTAPIELKRIGDLMGHSITNQRLYKWVLPSDDSDVDDHIPPSSSPDML